MAIAKDCTACWNGNHEEHDANHGIKPGVIGGTYCDCKGECVEFARLRTYDRWKESRSQP